MSLPGLLLPTGQDFEWTVTANKRFDYAIKGFRKLFWRIWSPINTPWQPAELNFRGANGIYGKTATETFLSLYIVVRVYEPGTDIAFTGKWK